MLALAPGGRGRWQAEMVVAAPGTLEAWLEAFDARGDRVGSVGSSAAPLRVACLRATTGAASPSGMRLGLVALLLLGALLLRSHPAAPDAAAQALGRPVRPRAAAAAETPVSAVVQTPVTAAAQVVGPVLELAEVEAAAAADEPAAVEEEEPVPV
jgi:hypothetical protein